MVPTVLRKLVLHSGGTPPFHTNFLPQQTPNITTLPNTALSVLLTLIGTSCLLNMSLLSLAQEVLAAAEAVSTEDNSRTHSRLLKTIHDLNVAAQTPTEAITSIIHLVRQPPLWIEKKVMLIIFNSQNSMLLCALRLIWVCPELWLLWMGSP